MKKRQSLGADLKLLFNFIFLCPICEVEVKQKEGSCETCGSILKKKHFVKLSEKWGRVSFSSKIISVIAVILIVILILVLLIVSFFW